MKNENGVSKVPRQKKWFCSWRWLSWPKTWRHVQSNNCLWKWRNDGEIYFLLPVANYFLRNLTRKGFSKNFYCYLKQNKTILRLWIWRQNTRLTILNLAVKLRIFFKIRFKPFGNMSLSARNHPEAGSLFYLPCLKSKQWIWSYVWLYYLSQCEY